MMAAFCDGYLIGAIPLSLLLTQAAGSCDIRRIRSGSIGDTNVLRKGNNKPGAATLLLDCGKRAAGVIAGSWCVLARGLLPGQAGPIVRHLYPVWRDFCGVRVGTDARMGEQR